MSQGIVVKIQEDRLDISSLMTKLIVNSMREDEIGGVATFTGRVRGADETGEIYELFLEHYPKMTEKKITEIARNAFKKWEINGCTIVHRVGKLIPGDLIVFVGVTSRHRKEAFDACAFIMDFLKTEAPFWKKETGPLGERWVRSRDTDYIARSKWKEK